MQFTTVETYNYMGPYMANPDTVHGFRTLLRRFERVLNRQLEDKNCCCGLTIAQCHPLLEIGRTGETTTVELSRALDIDKSTLSRTIDGLVNAGLVARNPHSNDRRYTVLTLTGEGRRTCGTINHQNDLYFARVFEQIPETDHESVMRYFGLLVEAMGRLEERKGDVERCCD
ncbi:MAG: MarR family winged helix-turn-helix transcriptional regulator [Bacteroidota bacterium]